MLMKICSSCGRSYPVNARCSCRSKSKRLAQYDKFERNQDSKKIYHSGRWRRMTNACKSRFFGFDCYIAMTEGRLVRAESGLSHHILEVAEHPEDAYTFNNLVWVSPASHSEIHSIYDKSEAEKQKLQIRLSQFVREGGIKNVLGK